MLSIERDAGNEKNPKQTKELLDDFKPCFWKNYSSLKKLEKVIISVSIILTIALSRGDWKIRFYAYRMFLWKQFLYYVTAVSQLLREGFLFSTCLKAMT